MKDSREWDQSTDLQSPLQHSALCVIAALDSLNSVLYLPSSVRWLGSFWISPSVLWLANCLQAVNWDSLETHLIICLRDQNPMLPIINVWKLLFQPLSPVLSLRWDAISGSCYSNILRSRKFSFLLLFFFFPYSFCFLFLRPNSMGHSYQETTTDPIFQPESTSSWAHLHSQWSH